MTRQTINAIGAVTITCAACSQGLGQEHVTRRLEESPRHHEFVDVTHGERTVKCWVVYPEVEGEVPAVIVIHENRGLNDWARSLADQVAEAGYIAVAPDLLSGKGPEGGGTSSFASSDDARSALYELDPDEVTADLNAAADYAKNLPACNGTIAVAGFCWGGSQTFRFATNRKDLAAAFVFYGTGPDDAEALGRIECPVYGFYGGNDNRVNSTIEASKAAMTEHGKTFEPVIYEGAGHGFMRAGEGPDASEANKKGRAEAWERWKKLLREAGEE